MDENSISLSNVGDVRTKQRLRGLMAKGSSEKNVTDTMNNLRRDLPSEDAAAVAAILFNHPLLAKLELTDDFPLVPPTLGNIVRLTDMPLEHELIFLAERVAKNRVQLFEAIKVLEQTNDAISSRNAGRIVTMLARLKLISGYSLTYLRKVAYLYSTTAPGSELRSICAEELKLFGLQRRHVVPLALTDLMDQDYEYSLTRSSLLDFAKESEQNNRKNAAEVLRFYFRPIRASEVDIASQIQTLGSFSLLDGVLSAVAHFLAPEPIAKIRSRVPELFPAEILTSIKLLNRSIDKIARSIVSKDGHMYLDSTFYRSSIAFIEAPRVVAFRDAIDSYYGDSLDGFGVLRTTKAADSFFGDVPSITKLAVSPEVITVSVDRYNNDSSGPFIRSIAFVRSVQGGATASDLDEDQLICLMANTIALEKMLSEDEIRSFFKYSTDQISKYIMLALVTAKSGKSAHDHALRRVLQDIVLKRFSGSLVNFAEWLFERGPSVAEHLVGLCTEGFLVQLYHLLPTTDEVFESRAALLDWFADKFNEPSARERAKTLRLDKRLQRVRGEINDVRIYVDHVRFTLWLQDNTIDELSAAFRSGDISEEDISTFSGEGGYPEFSTPTGRLAAVLQKAFAEFCADKRYGVDSYIGRRIRHGTLFGYLATQMEPLLGKQEYKDLLSTEAGGRLNAWIDDYRQSVTTFGTELLQVRSKKKPRGLLNPNIFGARRMGYTRDAIRDLSRQYRETKSLAVVQQSIIEHCWRILEQDLSVIRLAFDEFRRHQGNMPKSLAERGVPEQAKLVAASLVREVNRFTEERIRNASNWFAKPTNLSPSAPFSLLFEAVMDEVTEHFPDFEPKVEIAGEDDVTLLGVMYHHMYDFLYVIIFNAAKHGHRKGKVTRRIEFSQTDMIIKSMTITVSSEIAEDDTEEAVKMRVEDALSGNLDDAMVIENRSGIMKLRRMEADIREIESIDMAIADRVISFACRVRTQE